MPRWLNDPSNHPPPARLTETRTGQTQKRKRSWTGSDGAKQRREARQRTSIWRSSCSSPLGCSNQSGRVRSPKAHPASGPSHVTRPCWHTTRLSRVTRHGNRHGTSVRAGRGSHPHTGLGLHAHPACATPPSRSTLQETSAYRVTPRANRIQPTDASL